MKKETVKKLGTNELKGEINKIVTNEVLSKSKKMVELFNLGLDIKEISTIMNVRYNFVYNVVSNYVNVNKIKTVTNKKEGKKEKIIEMFKNGKTRKEISIELTTNYNYVFNVIKESGLDKESNTN